MLNIFQPLDVFSSLIYPFAIAPKQKSNFNHQHKIYVSSIENSIRESVLIEPLSSEDKYIFNTPTFGRYSNQKIQLIENIAIARLTRRKLVKF